MQIAFLAIIIITLLIIFAFYFTLTFFEHLHKGDERLTKQSKRSALICFSTAVVMFVGYVYVFLFVIAAGANSV